MRYSTHVVIDMETLEFVERDWHDYEGPTELACGPSGAEESLATSETNLSNQLAQNYSQTFQNNQAILGQLNNSLSPIVAAGPGQQGFTPQELNAMNTQALDTNAANYANAERSVQTGIAGQGGGTSTTPSGVSESVKGSVAAQAAGQLSAEQLGITQANYNTGRQNYFNALGALGNVAEGYNPTAYAGLASSANQNAFGEQSEIEQQSAQKDAMIGSLVASGVSMAGGGIGALGSGESFGEGLSDFISGAGGGSGSSAPV